MQRRMLDIVLMTIIVCAPIFADESSPERPERTIPDLSDYDADTLRTLARNLYRRIHDMEDRVAELEAALEESRRVQVANNNNDSESDEPAYMGAMFVSLSDIDRDMKRETKIVGEGVLISELHDGYSGDQAGLKEYDIIRRVDGKIVSSFDEAQTAIRGLTVGDTYPIVISRIDENTGRWKNQTIQVVAKTKSQVDEEIRKQVESERDGLPTASADGFTVTILDKSFRAMNVMRGDASDMVTMQVSVRNESGKDVEGVRLVVRVSDPFGDLITALNMKTGAIANGEDNITIRGFEYNQFINEDRQLRSIDLNRMKIELSVEQVIN